LEFLDHRVAERALGQHALDGLFQRAAGMLGLHVAEVGGTDAARIARVAVVHLVLVFRARHTELGSIDDDDEVTGVDVRRVNGLVFAAQTESNFAGYSSEHLIGGVNHKPLVRHVSGFRAERFHEYLSTKVWRALFHGRCSSGGNLLGGVRLSTPPSRGHIALRSPALYEKPIPWYKAPASAASNWHVGDRGPPSAKAKICFCFEER